MKREQFKDLRKHFGLTQPQLAEQLGISFRAVVNYEGGHRSIPGPVSRLMLIIKELGLDTYRGFFK